jgi:hypothetical protein
MSHTVRRRKHHTAHQRGWGQKAPTPHERGRHVRRTALKGRHENPVVTDHAIVRWLERVVGVDVRSQIKADILAEGRDELIAKVVNGRIRVNGTRTMLIVAKGFVVSVVIEDPHG